MEGIVAEQPSRIKTRPEFLNLASKGSKAAVHGVAVQLLARPGGAGARVGFTVTKKVGNAVVRNLARRRLREAVRLLAGRGGLPCADIVVIGRSDTPDMPFSDLQANLARALAKASGGSRKG